MQQVALPFLRLRIVMAIFTRQKIPAARVVLHQGVRPQDIEAFARRGTCCLLPWDLRLVRDEEKASRPGSQGFTDPDRRFHVHINGDVANVWPGKPFGVPAEWPDGAVFQGEWRGASA